MRRTLKVASMLALAGLAACADEIVYVDEAPPAPTGLTYQLEPSGDPYAPRGIVLRWNPVDAPNLAVYHVYSRGATNQSFGLRGSTTSPSFHDDGVPHLEYFVTAESESGLESDGSASVVVDERLRLPAPGGLVSVSLNSAIHLEWPDNAYQADPNGFAHYRVYSAAYDLDRGLCGTAWSLEGTTVAPTFLAAALANGVPRCFGISAVTIEGFESLWSPLRYDTPRPDGRRLVLYTTTADPTQSGFRFWVDANNDGIAGPAELAVVVPAGSATTPDFTVTSSGGVVSFTPVRAGTRVMEYPGGMLDGLTEIDIAPVSGYGTSPVAATPLHGYVFEMSPGDGFLRYGGVWVRAVTPTYVILDWSYQPDRGNPELLRER
jgi:hypothetical protein